MLPIFIILSAANEYFSERIKANKILNQKQAERVVMIREGKGKKDIRKTNMAKNWYEAKFRDFGEFRLEIDEQPPVITLTGISEGAIVTKGQTITCTVNDNLQKIYRFRAEIDGYWVMFTGTGPVFRYRIDEHCPAGNHVLKIIAEDVAGNITVKEVSFLRQ